MGCNLRADSDDPSHAQGQAEVDSDIGRPLHYGRLLVHGFDIANPAVTLARAFSNMFAGIRLTDVPLFIAAQFLGALCALCTARLITQDVSEVAARFSERCSTIPPFFAETSLKPSPDNPVETQSTLLGRLWQTCDAPHVDRN